MLATRRGAGRAAEPDDQLVQAIRTGHAGAWLIDWGLDNRSALIRIPPERGEGARMEVRLGDATANPYLASRPPWLRSTWASGTRLEPPQVLEGYGYDQAGRGCCRSGCRDALDALEPTATCEESARRRVLPVLPQLQAERGRAVRAARHRLGVHRVCVPPVTTCPTPACSRPGRRGRSSTSCAGTRYATGTGTGPQPRLLVGHPARRHRRRGQGRGHVLRRGGAVNLEELDPASWRSASRCWRPTACGTGRCARLLQRDFNARSLAGYETFLRGLTAHAGRRAEPSGSSTSSPR